VGVGLEIAQVLAMLFETALFLPETRDPRTVLPTIEPCKVMVDVQRAQGNPRAQPGIETSIHFTLRFHRTQRMTFAATDDHVLRIADGQGLTEPGLRQLPEQGALAAILAGGFGGDQ